jgi:hypothetical protein
MDLNHIICCELREFCYNPPTFFELLSALPKKDHENLEKGSVRVLSNASQVSIMRDL